jgi:phage terminase large subunit-like protein
MRALSADAALQHGLNPSANIIDELHAHRDGALYTALTTGTLAREQPFTFWITTAGATGTFLHDLVGVIDNGPGKVEERGALRIYRDRVNGTLIWWYGAPKGADIDDPLTWRATNPASWLHDGRVLGTEYARLRARGALAEWRTYHLNQFVEQLERWMPEDAWEASAGDTVLQRLLPTYVCVRVAHDNRSAAVAIAQKQGDKVALRVRSFPDHPLAEGDYVEAAPIEAHILKLRERYPAPVTAEVTYQQGGRVHRLPRHGPEVLHHGAFFESSRQRLAKQKLVLLDVPSTAERINPAAAALMQLVTSRALVHDGDAELSRQIGRVVARPTPKGWAIASSTGESIVAAQAAMLAVQRALTAPAPPSRRVHGL